MVDFTRREFMKTGLAAGAFASPRPPNVPEVVEHVKKVRKEGMGVVSMKLVGEGTFNREDRQKAMKLAFRQAGVDCATVGYKSTGQIDEAIENLNMALA